MVNHETTDHRYTKGAHWSVEVLCGVVGVYSLSGNGRTNLCFHVLSTERLRSTPIEYRPMIPVVRPF